MKPAKYLYFDCESGCIDEKKMLSQFEPEFDAPGNIKDPDKIAAAIESKKQKWIEDAGLCPERGQILAIGYAFDDGDVQYLMGEDEKLILESFVALMNKAALNCTKLAGFNILKFDLPFIRRRCLIHGISMPLYNRNDRWNPWGLPVYDAMADWCMNIYGEYVSCDVLARALGIGKKNGNGAEFSKMFLKDKSKCVEYIENEIKIIRGVCRRIMA